VNQLWNLGDSKNTLQLLAKATDEFDLIDLKDELSVTLQMCDQFTYDNVFVYFQPGTQKECLVTLTFFSMCVCVHETCSHSCVLGNGKIKVKEPTELAVKAMAQLSEAIDMAKRSAAP
jgi:hypothetical protein